MPWRALLAGAEVLRLAGNGFAWCAFRCYKAARSLRVMAGAPDESQVLR